MHNKVLENPDGSFTCECGQYHFSTRSKRKFLKHLRNHEENGEEAPQKLMKYLEEELFKEYDKTMDKYDEKRWKL